MKLSKRFAAALLCVVMVLTALTACGTATAKLDWENSRTKKYFESKGVTAQEYSLNASITASGQTVNMKYAIKGAQAGYEQSVPGNSIQMRVDEEGNVYDQMPSYGGKWRKISASSDEAKSYAASLRVCMGYFTVPDADSVGSISAGEYQDGGETYYMETIKLHQNGIYATYSYCYKGEELSFILMESMGGMMNNIELKPTADEKLLEIPQNYLTVE